MTALAQDVQRSKKLHEIRLETIPVKANTTIHTGALVCSQTADGLAVPAADAAGLAFRGVAHRGYDNNPGAAGVMGRLTADRTVDVDTNGPYSFAVDGAAPKGSEAAYVVDDNTVSLSGGANNVKVGKFTEPDPLTSGNWFVDVERAQGV